MQGYYQNEEATREVITEDGWLHTGDIGTLEDGYLKITDRKKDIIVTANGKNVAPQVVENLLKLDAYVTEAAVYGDKKPYMVGLIVPQFEKLEEYAVENNIAFVNREELVNHAGIMNMMEKRIEACQAELSNYSRIKKIRMLTVEFSIDNSEITPSLKLKRKIIGEKNQALIDGMYES
jgi:long-chain acyl-CoA synthetase